MTVAAGSGPFVNAGAVRRGPVPAATTLNARLVRLVRLVGDRAVVVLPLVGLLVLVLVLITAGCGPPN